MKVNNKLIKRILYLINKDQFDENILDIKIEIILSKYHTIKLNKILTIENFNIYENSCDILWNCSSVCIELCNGHLNYSTNGNVKLSIIEDDINYNHINDLCGNVYQPKRYELPYSVYDNFFHKSAITLFVDPLKYSELISLILCEFFKINQYPQDIKFPILILYNNLYY
jgi:hypothetical protein